MRLSLRHIVLALAWLHIITSLGFHALLMPLQSPPGDFTKHWVAAHELLAGRSPYEGELYLFFNYPMFTGYLFLYLAAFTVEQAKVVWVVGNLLLSVAGALVAAFWFRPCLPESPLPGHPLVARIRQAIARDWFTICFLITSTFQPLIDAYTPLNIEPLNWLLVLAFFGAVLQGRERLGGVLLACVVLVKVLPVVVVGAAVAARRGRLLQGFFGVAGAYALFLLLTGYWRMELKLYTDVLPNAGYRFIEISNSIHVVVARLVNPTILEDPVLFRRWSTAVTLALGFAFLGVLGVWWKQRRNNAADLYAFALAVCVSLTPLLEIHHIVWAAPVLFYQLREWVMGRLAPLTSWLALASWLLIEAIRIWNYYVAIPGLRFPVFRLTPLFVLLLLAVTARMAFSGRFSRERRNADSACNRRMNSVSTES